MAPSFRRRLIPVLLALATGLLYLLRLGEAPRLVAQDEIFYSLHAASLAETGQDLNGRFLPMYIERPMGFRTTWLQPMLIYATALTLKVLPLSEATVRLPMALVGILDVLLIYGVAGVLFRSELLALAAAVLLALTPAHFMYSRVATDFQLWVPFALGWLWSLLAYVERRRPALLVLSGGLLGTAVFGYTAAYLLAPMSAVLSMLVLWWRREPWSRQALFAAAVALPVVLALPWLLHTPMPFRDMFSHYVVLSASESTVDGQAALAAGTMHRFAELPRLYASFWDPRFLFVDGPLRFRSTQLVGVFLAPLAGLIVVGTVDAIRRRSPGDLLVLAGFLTAPIPVSVTGEGQAIWRALQVVPFGVLLAVGGLRTLLGADRRARGSALAAFAIAIAVAVGYHDVLPHAQAFIRAATVPLAVAGLAVLLVRFVPTISLPVVVAAGAVLAIVPLAYVVTNLGIVGGCCLLVGISVATMLDGPWPGLGRHGQLATAFLALVVSHFLFVYIEYPTIHRVGVLPASVIVLALRLALSAVTFAVLLSCLTRSRLGNRSGALWPAAGAAFVVGIQLAYVFIDWPGWYGTRWLYASMLIAAVVVVALLAGRGGIRRERIDTIVTAGVAGLVVITFGWFYADYLTDFQRRGTGNLEGNIGPAFEAVIARAASRPPPAVYLGDIGTYGHAGLYWRFYALKERRADLLARTAPLPRFQADALRALPPGSLVLASPSPEIDPEIQDMTTRGIVAEHELFRAADGTPVLWALETGAR